MLKNLDIHFAGINRQKGEISVFLQEDIRSHVCIPLALALVLTGILFSH